MKGEAARSTLAASSCAPIWSVAPEVPGALNRIIPTWSLWRRGSARVMANGGDALQDLAGWEPVNINVFASLSRLGNPKPPLKSRIAA